MKKVIVFKKETIKILILLYGNISIKEIIEKEHI